MATTPFTLDHTLPRDVFVQRYWHHLRTDLAMRRRLRQRLFPTHEPQRYAYYSLIYTYIMVLTDMAGMVKIGRSTDPARRAQSLRYDGRHGPTEIVETFPLDVERAMLDGIADSLGVRRARELKTHCIECVSLDPTLMEAATGVVYSASVDPTALGLPWLTPKTVGDHQSWKATEHAIDTKRGGVMPIYIVDGTCVPMIPVDVLESVGVSLDMFRDVDSMQRVRPQQWNPHGTKQRISHDLKWSVPVWRALDGIVAADRARVLTVDRDEIAGRIVWAAGQAAMRAEREYHGAVAYTRRTGHPQSEHPPRSSGSPVRTPC